MTAASALHTVHLVLPATVDDPAAPSGGNRYDLRIARELPGAGWHVTGHRATGAWPRPAPADRAGLARLLAALPDGATVLLDGLVACAAPGVLAAQAHRLRLAVLVHLPLADETGLDPAVAAQLDTAERGALHTAHAAIATSAWTARRLVTHHGLPPDRVHIAAPGTDPAPLAPGTDGGHRLLCAATVTPRKGQRRLAEALAALAGLPWECVCAGALDRDAQYTAGLRALIARHGLGDRFHLTGALTPEALAARYAAADLLVLPSYAEPYGMVLTEALARGIPVVATAVDGIPEAVGRAPDGTVPGVLVPEGSPHALRDALEAWLRDPGVRRPLRAAAHARRAMLTGWETTSRALAGVLETLSRQPRRTM
ncbi:MULTISPECIES: glycosyltransferase family 4 protein [Streptomyces]|uniref:D-inositol 3-phosphate glycosyltransferase n=1 Tax=Streptomyces ramulosus TaxID=47762 RepID=A0ABW1FBR9_9ACTN